MTSQRPRVLLGLAEISGYYARVGGGLRELGVTCDVVTLDAHQFAYGDDHTSRLVRLIRRIRSSVGGAPRWLRIPANLTETFLRFVLLLWCLPRYDVFVFGFRTTFLKLADLPILRLAGKRLVFVFHGSDSRPPVIDGFIEPNQSGQHLARASRRQRLRLRWIERFAHELVVQPLAAQFHSRPVVLYQAIGHPAPSTDLPSIGSGDDRAGQVGSGVALRVVHAPSNPVAKGTDRVRRTVEELRSEGRDIDYVELTGRTNAEVLDELARADVAIDQLFSDISLSVFAAEAAGAGVPPVVGGYGHDDLREILDPIEMAPGAYCHPDHLAATVRALADDPAGRHALGAEARSFIASTWNAAAVASRLLAVIEDRVPDAWRFDPGDLTYVHGAGLDEQRLVAQATAVVDVAGFGGLQLDERPDLRDRILDLVSAGRRSIGF